VNIPIELIAAVLAVLLAAVLKSQASLRRRTERLETRMLTIIIMLRDRGFKVPSASDTEQFLKTEI
jgi:hypothetical protein